MSRFLLAEQLKKDYNEDRKNKSPTSTGKEEVHMIAVTLWSGLLLVGLITLILLVIKISSKD